jgi:tetratricopeptide (TPR) repeat protein
VFETELEPSDGRRVTALGTMVIDLWALGRDDEARPQIERVEQLMGIIDAKEPRRASGLYVLAEARLRAGQPEAALERVNELVAMIDAGTLLEPDPVADSAALLGKILRALGRLDEARTRLETILDKHLGGAGEDAMPAGWSLRLELGHVERAAGRADAAREHYDAAWRLIGGYERAPTFGAEISLALASIEDDPAKAESQAREALAVLRDAGQRPDLQAEAEALLDSQP